MNSVFDAIATLAMRTEAVKLAERKLTGEKLRGAKGFIHGSRRTGDQIEQLVKRLEGLPDVATERKALPGQRSVLSDEEIERMCADRAAGVKLRELAPKYGVSIATASRICRLRRGGA